ncbi:hypothetical protein MTBBW1_1560003 [Desulfamplus magnetovallimortis]|uniref:Uncharacterized protein n=1 Tax=Desulfamplus magnetovallimortis TaxID=1246637 RepID=A0A1W1H8N6_9BACT|nr:hypothetical protein [Desulfamplus magnetovallimortis]SLM28794.1 hypothetical protein MTBBW1_1560003 [Desulfamplus magnetovallimortis]
MKNNVKNTLKFAENMQSLVSGMYNIFESTFEKEFPQKTNDVTHYVESKCCFQASDQYERPHEFLQSLLDILRVIYEPQPMGTFFFNSNPSFLLEAIPADPFQLAYGSFISKPNQNFKQFWSNDIFQKLQEYGYSMLYTTTLFVVVSTGNERYELELISEVSEILDSGFSPEEAIGLIASEIDSEYPMPEKEVYSGYCLVPELKDQLRVSLWMFNKEQA